MIGAFYNSFYINKMGRFLLFVGLFFSSRELSPPFLGSYAICSTKNKANFFVFFIQKFGNSKNGRIFVRL